ncbi:MAG TPA: phosphatidic acid phosphatase, partial [Cyclobacteriaceae bacterium]|nr:phosphatidic acid phosphatase [Cyclobacteriaceae bacterium]
MKRYFLLLLFFAGACSTNTGDYKPAVQNPEFLHRSIKAITDRIVHDIFSPPVASRIYTYSCVAGYEAIIAGNPKYVSLSGQLNGLEPTPKPDPNLEYCFELASIQATLQVGRQLIFSESDLDEFYNQIMTEFKNSGIPEDVYERSIE